MRGKRRPPCERVLTLAGPLPPCRVCGELAAGFHYGVNTCEACKGFFRRSLVRTEEYVCLGTGNCPIGPNRRKSCAKCRYLKCLRVGMSTRAIKMGRYTHNKRTQDTLEFNTWKIKHSSNVVSSVPHPYTTPECELASSSSTSASSDHSVLPEDFNHVDGTFSNDQPLSPAENNCVNETSENSTVLTKPPADPPPTLGGQSPLTDDCPPGGGTKSFSSPFSLCSSPESADASLTYCASDVDEKDQNTSPQTIQAGDEHLHIIMDNTPVSPVEFDSSILTSPEDAILSRPTPLTSDDELEKIISTLVAAHVEVIVDCNRLTNEELDEQIEACASRCKLKQELFGRMEELAIKDHLDIYNNTGLDADDRFEYFHYEYVSLLQDIREIVTFTKAIPGFSSLCLADQNSLVRESMFELLLLTYYRGYHREEMIIVEVCRSFCVHDIKKMFNKECLDILFNITGKLQQLNLNFEIVVILKAFCMVFCDRVKLREYQEVEKIQSKLLDCLTLVLRRAFPDNHSIILARIFAILTDMRSTCLEFEEHMRDSRKHYEGLVDMPVFVDISCLFA